MFPVRMRNGIRAEPAARGAVPGWRVSLEAQEVTGPQIIGQAVVGFILWVALISAVAYLWRHTQ